jgi:hypothetical protein
VVRLLPPPWEFPLEVPPALLELPTLALLTLSGREGGAAVLALSLAFVSRFELLGLLLCSARFWAEPFVGERGR